MKVPAIILAAALAHQAAFAADLIPKRAENLSLRNEVQIAVNKGLAALKSQQSADGSWSMAENPALTALPLTAFMNEPGGTFRKEKPEFIKKGYDFLLGCVQPDGGIYRKGLANYNTSLALTALAAAGDEKFRPTIEAARNFVIGQQARGLANASLDGGIGYGPTGSNRAHPDLSNTVMALDALRQTGTIPGKELARTKDLNWAAVREFIQRTQNLPEYNKEPWASDDPANKGGFIYFPGNSMAGEMELANGKKALRSYGSMSYAGLLSYIYADLKKDDPRVEAVVGWLKKHYTLDENPGMGAEGLFYYYHMMAKALATYGITELELADGKKVDWRKDLAIKLINLQKPDGTWTNEAGRWMEKDPALVTSYAVLALEIIYRAM